MRFLDDVVDVGTYPTAPLADAARATRRIVVGVMGPADALIALGVAYDSDEALKVTGRLLRIVGGAARRPSWALAAERGAYPAWPSSRAAQLD